MDIKASDAPIASTLNPQIGTPTAPYPVSVIVSGASPEHHDLASTIVQLSSGPLIWAFLLIFIFIRWGSRIDRAFDALTDRIEDGDDVAIGKLFKMSVAEFGSIKLSQESLDNDG